MRSLASLAQAIFSGHLSSAGAAAYPSLSHSLGRREVEGRDGAADQKVARPPDSADGRVGCARNVRSVQVSRDVVQLSALQLQNRATVARSQRVVDNPPMVWVGPRPDLDQEAGLGPHTQALGCGVVAEHFRRHAVDEVDVLPDVLRQVDGHALVNDDRERRQLLDGLQDAVDAVARVGLHIARKLVDQGRAAAKERLDRAGVHLLRASPRAGNDRGVGMGA